MPRPPSDKRERLTAAAATLAHARGLAGATIGAIADEAGVAPGSVYYYFRTRDDIARAVVDAQHARYRDLLDRWDEDPDPRARLVSYVDHHLGDVAMYRAHGCPVATLSLDLRREDAAMEAAAASVPTMLIGWVTAQFEALGFAPAAARARATHLFTGIQGAAALTHALDDPAPLEREGAHLKRWIAQTRSA
ncbi:TetR/AcrR family transcriptional regulator [Demequina sp. SYSU T00192]|uniref:TetR/AcrR family transcriptional regulator n=1 Tax=Demequina litoralis TaxID=3051660 RepID=A0ABT8G7X8_9MICO|nr:TetR/AcrR family transcriptional regulator [Demequina sp. SYSU T00192]MDN4475256.1 TetR/AcrR family transcriptional regulator [Demequina sp. SYSU T00192]